MCSATFNTFGTSVFYCLGHYKKAVAISDDEYFLFAYVNDWQLSMFYDIL